MTETAGKKYVPNNAAADHLGLGHQPSRRLRLKGDGPPFLKFGRRVMSAIEDLDEWARSRRRRSTSEHAGRDMLRENESGPVERGNVPSGPNMLSVADGGSTTSKPICTQGHAPAAIAGTFGLVLIAAPDPARVGHFTARLLNENRRLIAYSRMPFCDAARALLAQRFDAATPLNMRHAGSATLCLSAPICRAAQLAVEESAHGPVFRTCRMAERSAVGAPRVRADEPAGTDTADRPPSC
jgi:hypothetical protein